MPTCSNCKSFHLFGKKDALGSFCNDKCLLEGKLKALASTIPPELLQRRIAEIHQGNCPRCSGGGPVDVHTTHEVWSAVVLTSWKSIPALSCKSCGVKRQLGALAFSGFLGWWGFPFGLILTPIQVVRNLVGMLGGPHREQPSRLLVDTVTRYMAAEFTRQQGATAANAGAQQYVPP